MTIPRNLIPFTSLLLLAGWLEAAELTLGDLMTPVKDGDAAPSRPKQPGKIKKNDEVLTKDGKKTTVVQGADIQDAAVAVAMELEEEEEEVMVFKSPDGGVGVMARGTAFYRTMQNRNASLISKRLAYVQAYMQAKGHLAQYCHGLKVDAAQDLVTAIDAYDSANSSVANTALVANETNFQKVEGLIRGYVLYEVKDDVKEQEVSVTIASTPVTRGETMRATPAVIVANDIQAGMRQVMAEINSAVVPPECGRVISVVNKKGEQDLYFVGFGSEIIRMNNNKTVAKRLEQASKRVAQMRAAASLVGLITGDRMMWSSGMAQQTLDQHKQFDLKGDPMMAGEGAVIPIKGTLDVFQNRIRQTDAYRSAQKGMVPPGVPQPKTWKSKDGDWLFSAYIYNPKITLAAQGRVVVAKNPKPDPLPSDTTKPGSHPSEPATAAKGNSNKGHCPPSTATLKVIKRTVEAYGHTREVAILHGLTEAVAQVNGLSLNAAQKMSSSIRQFIKETDKSSKESVEIEDLSSEQIRTATKGLIAGFKVLDAGREDGEWKVSLEVCVYRYVSPSNKTGLPTLAVTNFQFAKPTFLFGLQANPQPRPANQIATRLSQNLINKLFDTGRFRVLDRRHVLEVQREKGFLIGQNAPLREFVRFGAALGADYVLVGAINDFSQIDIPYYIKLLDERGINSIASIAVDFRIIEVGTREVIWSDSVAFAMGKKELNRLLPQQKLQKMHDATTDAMINAFMDAVKPIKVSHVTKGGVVVVNQGRGRLKIGDTFTVHAPGETYVDPDGGKKKTTTGDLVAVMRIDRVALNTAYGSIMEGSAPAVKHGGVCVRAKLLPPKKGPVDDGTPGLK